MAGTIKGIIVEIGGDTSGLQKALKNVNSATSSLGKELRGINSLLKLDPSNTELLAQKQTVLAKNIEQTSNKLEELKKIQQQADEAIENGASISEENYRNLQREIISTENKLKDLQVQASNWTKAGDKLEEFGTKVTNISSKIDTLGSTLTTSLTLPVLAIGTAAVTTGNDFEAQMSRVQAIAGATKDELQELTNQAMDLGAETTFSASQVAEGMENLASAGFTTKEIMDAMPGLLDLAASSGADLATSSEIAASAIRGFGLEASSSAHVADIFAEASARTNAQVEDMGYAMKYIAPVANTMGLKIEEVAAAIGIMSDAGIKGEQAGTTLRGALVRLTKPTDKMIGVMEELGISFYDNEGKMKSLTEMISMLQDATKGLTDEQEQNALTTLFGTESLSGMVALINRGSEELSDMTKSFENCDGAAQNMADTMLDNTKGAFESLSGSLESAGIAIQQALAPSIKELSGWIQDLVDDFNDLSDEEKDNIVKTALLVAAIGPAVKILGTLGKGIGTVSKGLGTLSQAISLIGKTTTTSFNKASKGTQTLAKAFTFLKSPLGLITVSITGLTIATLKYIDSLTKVDPELQKMIDKNTEFSNSLNDSYATINKDAEAKLAEIENSKKLSDELKKLVDANGNVKKGYEDRVNYILSELSEATGEEYKIIDGQIQKYQELIDKIDEALVKQEFQVYMDASSDKYTEAINNETEALENYMNAVEETKKKQDEYNKAKEEGSATERFNALKNLTLAQDAEEEAELTYGAILNTISDYTKQKEILQSGDINKMQEYLDKQKSLTAQQTIDAGANLSEQISQAGDYYSKLEELRKTYASNDLKIQADRIAQQQAAYEQELLDLGNQLVNETNKVKELTPEQIAAWKNLADGSFYVYSEAIRNVGPEMQAKIQEATGIVAANTPEFAAKAGEMGQQVAEQFDKNATAKESALSDLQGFYEGLNDEEKKQLLQETVGERADEVAEQFANGDYETSGKNVLQGLYNGLSDGTLGKNLINKAAGIAKSIANQFNIQWDEHSPSKLMKKKTEYLLQPISTVFSKEKRGLINDAKNLAKGITQGFDSAFNINTGIKAPNMSGLSREIKQQTQTIFTTPQITFNVQQMDEKNLETCFNYLNKKFGSKY